MKTKTMMLAGLVTVFSLAFVTTYAQLGLEPSVKILPTNQQGILKVLYAYDIDKAVEVKFFDEGGLITRDKVQVEKGQHGFMKKYDVRNIRAGIFWVEISTPNISVTYRLTESKDGTAYVPSLEKAIYSYPVVASND